MPMNLLPTPDATPSVEPAQEPNRFNAPMINPTTSLSPSSNPLRGGGGQTSLRRQRVDANVTPAAHAE
jgi:hypothetical protein